MSGERHKIYSYIAMRYFNLIFYKTSYARTIKLRKVSDSRVVAIFVLYFYLKH